MTLNFGLEIAQLKFVPVRKLHHHSQLGGGGNRVREAVTKHSGIGTAECDQDA